MHRVTISHQGIEAPLSVWIYTLFCVLDALICKSVFKANLWTCVPLLMFMSIACSYILCYSCQRMYASYVVCFFVVMKCELLILVVLMQASCANAFVEMKRCQVTHLLTVTTLSRTFDLFVKSDNPKGLRMFNTFIPTTFAEQC